MEIVYGNIVSKEATYREYYKLQIKQTKFNPLTDSTDLLLQIFSAGVEFAEDELKRMNLLKEVKND